MYLVSLMLSISFTFSILETKQFNKLLNLLFEINELLLVGFIFLIIIMIFSIFYILYEIGKYEQKNINSYLAITAFILLVLTIIIEIINKKFLFLNYIYSYVGITIIFFSLLFIVSFYNAGMIYINRKIIGDPIKNSFKYSKSKLNELLKEFNEFKNQESKEIIFYKNLIDIFYIINNYKNGINGIKKSFGKVLHFDEIKYLKMNKNLNEILNQLTVYIPYYIFYGDTKQIQALIDHLENINKYIGDNYSIAGNLFVEEILEFNNKLNIYFKENNLLLFDNKNKNIDKYLYHKNQIFLFILTLLSSIILSYRYGQNFIF